jgi:protein-S-isoprenylcysteine O-methyltransferase Ste14
MIAWTGGALFVFSLACTVVVYAVVFGRMPPPWSPGAGTLAVAVDVALFSAFALHHSLFARAGLRGWVARRVSERYERSVYVYAASLLLLAVLLAWRTVPGVVWCLDGPWTVVLAGVQLAGVAITLASARRLDALTLAGIRQARGARITASSPALVRDGLYALVRHPIYFGWVLMVWPTACLTGDRAVFALVSTAYLAAAIPFEERSLRREFGAAYDDYARDVRWRMVPGIY